MPLTGARTFVGFGLGPIQAGLFLHEALRSGSFGRLVVAEVLPEVVESVRRSGGVISVNIAHFDGREVSKVGPVEILDPAQESDRRKLIVAVSEADEMATAVPSVLNYASPDQGSIHSILAEGLVRKALRRLPRAVVYAAENHNRAAEILLAHVFSAIPAEEIEQVHSRVRFLNTVIGKMSGVVSDPREVRKQRLAAMTPLGTRAFLVEEFNRILISRIDFDGGEAFCRGITVFEQKQDLLPFEEAKLYGHNATHALAAFVGAELGARRIADLASIPGLLSFVEAAFIRESGEALIRRHAGIDPLFTTEGYRAYALDLIKRMTNPYLLDTVERVGRDPGRKLGWDDRLVGTMRIALDEGLRPRRFAFGAAAALAAMGDTAAAGDAPVSELMDPLWKGASADPCERDEVLKLIDEGRTLLKRWRRAGFPDLEALFQR